MDKCSNQQPNKGKFFVIEGIDCCGKDTQIELVSKKLSAMNYKVFITYEPCYDGIGKFIRSELKNGLKINPDAFALLMIADRINHCDVIKERLEDGYIVLCSRYLWSNLAYNTDGSYEQMRALLKKNVQEGIIIPDGLIYLDITPEESVRRMSKRPEKADAYENLNKQKAVYENYQNCIDMLDLDSILVVDGAQDKGDICDTIANHIISKL